MPAYCPSRRSIENTGEYLRLFICSDVPQGLFWPRGHFGLLECHLSGHMRSLLYLPVFSACLAAQTAVATDAVQLLRDLRTAIQEDSLATAAELAGKLDLVVQERYSASLIRDADQRIDEALGWLPGDTESVWVNREPFTI